MNERISEKIEEIEGYLDDLSSYVPSSFEEYIGDSKTRDACEHCFEKIIESLADLSFIFIDQKGWDAPKDDIGAFFALAEKNIITEQLAFRLRETRGMRNIIAHEYGKVNDELVFESINGEIFKDAEELINRIKERVK